MPNNTRQWAHRKIEMARGNIKTSGLHLMEISEVYKDNHEQIAEALFIINKILVECDDRLDTIKRSF